MKARQVDEFFDEVEERQGLDARSRRLSRVKRDPPKDREFLTSQEVAEWTGISYRMVDYYANKHGVGPKGRGSGTRRRWTWPEIERLEGLAALDREYRKKRAHLLREVEEKKP